MKIRVQVLRVAVILIVVYALGYSVAIAALPPDILADKYLLAAKKKIEAKDFSAAVTYFEKIEKLNIQVPPVFYYHYGKSLLEIGSLKKSENSLSNYITLTGRKGKFYTSALELIVAVEESAVKKAAEAAEEAEKEKEKEKEREREEAKIKQEEAKRQKFEAPYKDNGDGTISESNFGLMWTKKDSYATLGKCLDWNDSKEYVANLRTGGYTDWRLPTIRELQSIYNEQLQNTDYLGNTSHLSSKFASGGAWWYWSSEEAGSCCARFVLFDDGNVNDNTRDYCNSYGVRAVRRGH